MTAERQPGYLGSSRSIELLPYRTYSYAISKPLNNTKGRIVSTNERQTPTKSIIDHTLNELSKFSDGFD